MLAECEAYRDQKTMSGNGNGNGGGGTDSASATFLKDLQESGFFDQVKDLQGNISRIALELKGLGERATERLEETESLAAHVLAIEAVLTAVLRSVPVDKDEIRDLVREEVSSLTGGNATNTLVQSVAESLIEKSIAD